MLCSLSYTTAITIFDLMLFTSSAGIVAQTAPTLTNQSTPFPQVQTTSDKLATGNVVSQPLRKSDYILGPADRLSVRIFGADDLPDKPIEVGADGNINLPMVGMVHAAGISVRELETELTKRYSTYFKAPEAEVSVVDYRSQPVTVAGAVNNPNMIQLHGPTRLMEVLSLAGGLKPDAGNTVLITRKAPFDKGHNSNDSSYNPDTKFDIRQIDLLSIIDGTDPSANIVIQANDLITVSKAKMVYVVGDVPRPGGYVLDGHSSSLAVLKAIALAGGVNKTAAASKARILRSSGEGDTHRAESQVNIKDIMANKSPDIALHADDILLVPNSTAKNVSIRALEMAVNVGTGLAIWRF
jgi:polysaccharide export outer membrane protein